MALARNKLDKHLTTIQHIANHPDPSQVPILIAYVAHDEPHAAWAAAWALARVWSPQAADPLVDALSRVDLDLAVFAHLRGSPAVDRLVAMVDHEDRRIRSRVMEALVATRDERAIEPLRRALANRPESDVSGLTRRILIERFAPLIDDALDACLHRFHPLAAKLSANTVDGEELVRRLEEHLGADSRDVRERAAVMLYAMATDSASAALRCAARDPDREVRHTAIRGLDRLADDPAIADIIASAFADPDEHIQHMAANMLGKRGDPRAHEYFWSRRDGPWPLRRESWTLMARTARSAAKETSVPAYLREQLGPLSRRVRYSKVIEDHSRRLDVLTALSKLDGTEAADLLAFLMGQCDDLLRPMAAAALHGLGDPRALPELLHDLGSTSCFRCVEAAEVLASGAAVPRMFAPALTGALRVRRKSWVYGPTPAIAVALGKTGAPEALPHLLSLVAEPEMTQAGRTGLTALLQFAATELDTAGLRAVAALPNAVLHRYDWTTAGYESTIFEIASVDLSPLKRLARRELMRRGETSASQKTACEE